MLADLNPSVNGKCVPFAHFRKGSGILRERFTWVKSLAPVGSN
jgi:hypothetical protein